MEATRKKLRKLGQDQGCFDTMSQNVAMGSLREEDEI